MCKYQVAIVARQPANSHEIRRKVEPALAAELDVMQRGKLDPDPARPAKLAVALQNLRADLRRHIAVLTVTHGGTSPTFLALPVLDVAVSARLPKRGRHQRVDLPASPECAHHAPIGRSVR